MPTSSNSLVTLVNAIPTAQDGHIITPQYHNTLRNAVTAIAAELGSQTGTGVTFVTSFPPIFFPEDDDASKYWSNQLALATRPAGNTAKGWFPMTLQDGARILSLTVIGRKFVSAVGALSLRVLMRRKSLTEVTDDQTFINVDLKNINGEPFRETRSPTITGTSSDNLKEVSLVDNSKYLYYVRATMSNAPGDLQMDFYAFQVAYLFG